MDIGAEPPSVTGTPAIPGFQRAYSAVGGTGLPQKGGRPIDRRSFTTEPPLDLLPKAFQGRDDLKPELASALTARRRGLRVLHGIAGGGKSSLALWLARQARDQGRPVYWVGNGDVEQSMHAVAVRRGVDIGQLGRADAQDVVWRSLEGAAEPWLLVFDNIDDVDQRGLLGNTGAHVDGTGWIRPSRAGLVVVTSRRGDRSIWGEHAELTRVNCLDAEDGARVLLGFAPNAGPPADARLLAERLGGLPLALRLAGHYLANDPPRHRTFAAYHRAVQDDLDLLDVGEPTPATLLDDDSARLSIRLTWELSLSLLEERRLGAARPLLHLLACYGAPHPIPSDVLVAEHLRGTPVDSEGTLTDGKLTRLIVGLVSSALADQTDLDDTPHLTLHPLLAEVIAAARDESPHADDIWTAAVTLLAENGPEDSDPTGWAAWQALPAVVAAVLNRVPEHLDVLADAVEGGNLVATYLLRTGAIHASHDLSALTLRRANTLPPRHPARLSARLAAAIVAKTEGGSSVVRDELAALYDEASETPSPDPVFLVVLRQHLAESLWLSGEFDAAEDIYLELVADHERGVAPDQALATRFGYGRMMATHGEFDLAERELTAVLEAEREVHDDPDHPELLLTRAILADIWLGKGELVKARDELEDVLRAQERLHGPDSPLTLSARVTLMAVHAQLRDQGGANIQLNRLLRIQRDALNPEHPLALLGLAALINSRAYDPSVEADPHTDEQRLTEVASALARQMGEHHPMVLSTRFGAALQRYQYDKPGGIAAVESVLERQVDVLGRHHIGTLNTRLLYAQLLVDIGEDDAVAEEELRDLVETQRESIGTDHPQAVMARTSLANIVLRNGDQRGAEELIREAMEAMERLNGPDHTDTRETRLALVQLLCMRDAFTEAERQLLALIGSLRRTEPGSDEQLAAQVMLALVLMDDGRVEEAERELRQVLASLAESADDHRYDRFMVQWFLAMVLRARDADEEAEALLADSVAGLVELGEHDDDLPNVRLSYAELLHDTGRLHDAERQLQLVAASPVEDDDLEDRSRALLSAVLAQLEEAAAPGGEPPDPERDAAGADERRAISDPPPTDTPPTDTPVDPPDDAPPPADPPPPTDSPVDATPPTDSPPTDYPPTDRALTDRTPADRQPTDSPPTDSPPAGSPQPTDSWASSAWLSFLAGSGPRPEGVTAPVPEPPPPPPRAAPPTARPTPRPIPRPARLVATPVDRRPDRDPADVRAIDSGRDYRQDLRTCAEIAARLRAPDLTDHERTDLRHRYGLLLADLGLPSAAHAELSATLAACRRIGAPHWTCLVDAVLTRPVDDDSITRIDRARAEVAAALGPRHRLVARLWRAGAELRAAAGDPHGAIAELTDALAMSESPDGDRAAAHQALATAVWQAGDQARARALHAEAVRAYAELFDARHPHVLRARADLAATSTDHTDAIPVLRDLLHEQLRRRGPAHPDVAATRHHLGVAAAATGDPTTAQAELTAAVRLLTRRLGPRHPWTRRSSAELAGLRS